MRKIIVNATALTTGGGINILNQFIDHLSEGDEYLIFINSKLNIQSTKTNVNFVKKNINSFLDRLIQDFYGINRWLNKNKIYPSATISLQNTNFRYSNNIPNFIYFHQALPFSSKRWNPFKKTERTLWFYKNVYPFFIKLFINKNTEIFVQTNSVRNNFAYHFNFPINKIHVVSPKFNPLTINHAEHLSLKCDEDRLNIFYPATTFPYKNHQIILNALNKIDPELVKLITLHLTCKRSDLKYLEPLFHNININFLGEIPHSKVIETYLRSDALLFPSYIETYGLPLIEAASLGLPIIVADLPYAREVLMDYEGVKFVPYDNIQLWKDEIVRLFDLKGKRHSPHVAKDADSWTKLFKIVKNKIHNNVQQ